MNERTNERIEYSLFLQQFFFFPLASLKQVLELAEKTTKESDPVVAKQQFLKLINSSSQFYNEGDIPANESDANAHKLCSDMKGAEMYCPNRTKAMKNWFAHTKEVRL